MPESATAFLAAPTANCVCRPLVFPILRVFAHVGYRPMADFRGDFGGEMAGVEQTDIIDARSARQKRLPYAFDIGAQRRYPTDAGNHDTSLHMDHGLCLNRFNPGGRHYMNIKYLNNFIV
jgi:hypothetical protein